MQLLNFPHAANLVVKSSHVLYNAASASPLVLTGTLPSVGFRCSVRLYIATTKTDCAGTVTIGSEVLSFGAAGTKFTTILLYALPTIITTGLNCMIEIVAVDSHGARIEDETLTGIKIRFEPTTKMYTAPGGAWTQSIAYAMIVNTTVKLDDVIRYNSIDYSIKQIEAFPWLDGTELYRILYF